MYIGRLDWGMFRVRDVFRIRGTFIRKGKEKGKGGTFTGRGYIQGGGVHVQC